MDASGRFGHERLSTWTRLTIGTTNINTNAQNEGSIGWVAAHYLGHAMGISDGFGWGYTQRYRTQAYNTRYGDVLSVMNTVGTAATRLDVALATRAHSDNQWQTFGGNIPLIRRYGIGWMYQNGRQEYLPIR